VGVSVFSVAVCASDDDFACLARMRLSRRRLTRGVRLDETVVRMNFEA